jgi:hypothetical protein
MGAYRRDKETGNATFSRNRAAVTVLSSIAAAALAIVATPLVLTTLQQAVMALISEREAYTYFHGSETIIEGELYSVKTTSRVPSTPDSTAHMQVEQDLIYRIFYPEDLANAVPNEVAWGRVKYTGWRFKPFNWFPEVKDIEAVPMNILPAGHPATSGTYYLSPAEVKEAKRDGVILPGTNLSEVLRGGSDGK